MALPREEQAKIVRILASMVSANFSIRDALLSLVEDYRKYGLIEVPPSLAHLVPEQLRVGWVAEKLEEMVYEIEAGQEPAKVFLEADIFDEDVRASIASGIKAGNLPKMAVRLADLLETEVELLGKLKKTLIGPVLSIIIGLLFTYIMVFKFTPKIVGTVTYKDRLPATVKAAYVVSQHPLLFVAAVVALAALVILFLKSGVWKPYLPAYREFEKLRFLNWLKILFEASWSETKVFQFLSEAGFSKKWREAIEEVLYRLEGGEDLQKAMEVFVERGLLSHSDYSFIKSGIRIGNIPKQVEPSIRLLKVIVDKSMEKTITLVQAAFLMLVGGYVAFLYIGLLLPMTTSIQRAM
ncbi:Type II secretion system F domain protein (plasmid) [Thermovibrio ammonificans HB-1]|uniref:Type II secretion system F domain protein n=1 Tax=Thermovibrio ammonificans (strain DSM 15698 / JCM 12110 / HB-1) TaxID=648996 RepID=E8T6T3_THEA1|nr:type II secretion system F family protein [Thermovibrio ammonificans]ADU97756.1 Type II secretion system F domain protein [Thermovibrio ammonificans HB-1]